MKTKIKIIKQIQQEEIIEIELPYYYKHDLNLDFEDSIIYGKIGENFHISIQESKNNDGKEIYEIEKEIYPSIENSGYSCYFEDKYKSNKKEFEAVKERCLNFLKNNL